MKRYCYSICIIVIIIALLAGCAPATTPPPPTTAPSPIPPTVTTAPTLTPSPIPPTSTPEPSPTPTEIPSPTPLPGVLVFPVETLGKSSPWLPLDKAQRPGVNFVGFNTVKPPFNSPLVRKAFAYAVDRDVLVDMAIKYRKDQHISHASSLTPPETLGRDLYGEVGINFNPGMAKQMLAEAGYSNSSAFPSVLFLVNASGDIASGARFNMANAMADMWQTYLGLEVEVQAIGDNNTYYARLKTNTPDIYWGGWAADYNDPDNFLSGIFHTGFDYNYGNYSNREFDELTNRALISPDPAERQALYIEAERMLCETDAAIIPLYHSTYSLP